ncbi:MAG: caspase family protein [Bacteroidales bacterium]|nr:caspase family protein [Bacteroidales bacterium]
MKKTVQIILFLFAINLSAMAQVSGVSPVGSLHIGKQFLPPSFVINGKPMFKDQDNNRAINANEKCEIVLSVTNNGRGTAQGLKAVMNITGDTNELRYSKSKNIPDIKVGETREVHFVIEAGLNTVNGQAQVEVKIQEPHALGTLPQYLVLETRAFEAPLVKCMDYALEGEGVLTLGQPFTLNMVIQNIRSGKATDVKVNVKLPTNVISGFDGTSSFYYSYSVLAPGESKDLKMPMYANLAYDKQDIPIKVKISEHYGKYAVDTTIHLKLQEVLLSRDVIVARKKETIRIDTASLKSDVDKNIPVAFAKNDNLYVMIIANQTYNNEQDVSTALNDGRTMQQYCIQTLGVPENQIRMYENRTYVQMKGDISSFANTMNLNKGNSDAKFMVFYFGHGMADQNKNIEDSYLLPVDATTQRQLKDQAISRNWMMEQFSNAQPRQLVVFLESCFSGACNTDDLLAYGLHSSGTRFEDKTTPFKGNILVLTASSGMQTANAYPTQRHNIFTYEFLKILQSTKGDISLGLLFDRLKQNTSATADRIYNGDRQQTPGALSSSELKNQWRNWKLK